MTYRFVVLDLPLEDAVDALASLAARRRGARTPIHGAPAGRICWPREPRLARAVPLGPTTGWCLTPSMQLRSAGRRWTVSVELLPWDDGRTELGLRLDGRKFLPLGERYERMAEAVPATIATDLSVERAFEPAYQRAAAW